LFRTSPEPLEKHPWVPRGVEKLYDFDMAEVGTVSMYLLFVLFLILAPKMLTKKL
jgi:hypothetical protein